MKTVPANPCTKFCRRFTGTPPIPRSSGATAPSNQTSAPGGAPAARHSEPRVSRHNQSLDRVRRWPDLGLVQVVGPAGNVRQRCGRHAVELPAQPDRELPHQFRDLIDRRDADTGGLGLFYAFDLAKPGFAWCSPDPFNDGADA